MKKRIELNKEKKNNKRNKRLLLVTFILFLISIGLIFNTPVTQYILSKNTKPTLDDTNSSKIKKDSSTSNSDDFNFKKAKKADINTALKSRFNDNKVPVLGAIAIPDLKINLPILRGVSDYAILMGAGTMKKDQQMGQNNYALTSHHMLKEDVLFGPIINTKIGTKIYLTDLENTYEYEAIEANYIEATDVHVIQDESGKDELTLITCDDTGEGRFMVKAKFNKLTAIEDTDTDIINYFYGKQNSYD